MERLHKVHVVITILLHLEQQGQLRGALFTEWQEQGAVGLQGETWSVLWL